MGKRKGKNVALKGYANEAAVRRDLEYWQPRLGLSDWTFEVGLYGRADYPRAGGEKYEFLYGSTWVDTENQHVRLALLRQSEHGYAPRDMEHTLIHELLHVVDAKDRLTEAQINILARALLGERRGVRWADHAAVRQ